MKMWKFRIEGRDVYVYTGKITQTVNICTSDRQRGKYELTLRLPVEKAVTLDEVNKFGKKDDLVTWLEKRGAQKEIAIQRTDSEDGAEVEILEAATDKQSKAAPKIDDPWITKAAEITESCIHELLEEFLECPYLHRVEHSLHVRFYELLHSRPHLDRQCQPQRGLVYQFIHKEWPEAKPRPEKNNRRGNFDIAILSPGQFDSCTPHDFSQGLLAPPIAVEMGLNYDMKHLLGDADKMINSEIKFGYLIHLVRDRDQVTRSKASAFIKDLNRATPTIKIAFGQVCGKEKFIKLLNDTEIRRL